MLESEFPECQIIENESPKGSIPSRDMAFRHVKSDLIISLDDDSYPEDSAFLKKVDSLVKAHPEVGAFTFPEIRNDGKPANTDLSVNSSGKYIRDFPNCAGVLRRSLYGDVASYPTFFSHTYEEPDYCLQLYSAGYGVWFEPSLTIRHHFTPKERNMLTRHWLNARNELWSVLLRCPFPLVLLVVPVRILRQLIFSISKGLEWWVQEPRWWLDATRGIGDCLKYRKAVSNRCFYAWTRLARRPVSTIEELRMQFGEKNFKF
jgi:GT2 family glycosyltransferase